MDITLHLGSWLVPTLITIVAFGIAYAKRERSYGGWIDMSPLWNLILYGIALVVSLIAWLIWALWN